MKEKHIGVFKVRAVISLNREPQYKPQNTIGLIMGTPKRVPMILGNTHVCLERPLDLDVFSTCRSPKVPRKMRVAKACADATTVPY